MLKKLSAPALFIIGLLLILIGILLGVDAVSTPANPDTGVESYPLVCRVHEVSHDDNTVIFEDYNGHLWEMYGAEDWVECDCAVLMMMPSGTSSIFDDEIISARYSAWTIWR